MSGKKVFYAVRKGRRPGIFPTWAECKLEIDKFPGAEYKKFFSLSEAETFIFNTGTRSSDLKNQVFTDGGSRDNPGISGCGAVLLVNGAEVSSAYKFLSFEMTNNLAEYHGLLLGLQLAQWYGLEEIEVCMDSLLIVNQVKGEWKVNEPALAKMHQKIINEISGFKIFKILHVLREFNTRADSLAQEAMDLSSRF